MLCELPTDGRKNEGLKKRRLYAKGGPGTENSSKNTGGKGGININFFWLRVAGVREQQCGRKGTINISMGKESDGTSSIWRRKEEFKGKNDRQSS